MFVPISNTPRDYAWGSAGEISALLGTPPTGRPEAELWLGAHPSSPSVIDDPAQVGGATNLAEWIANDPNGASGAHGQLPYLLKILAAGGPLSLQAHPTLQMAKEGFARENAEGLAIDAPNRNYKDALHKPEVIYALSETFEALCGFRPLGEIRSIVDGLQALDAAAAVSEPEPLAALAEHLRGDTHAALESAVKWLLSGSAEVGALVARVTALVGDGAGSVDGAGSADGAGAGAGGLHEVALATAAELAIEYPGDPGIVLSLLLNRVTLQRGEALFLPAGNIHAYLKGLGVELMAASDNVLRGGLTPKYIDVPELLKVLRFESLPVPYLEPGHPSPGVEEFQPDVTDFVLVRVVVGEAAEDARYLPLGPAIVIATAGDVTVSSSHGAAEVARGDSFYITPDEGELTFSGAGELFLAAPGARS